MFDRRRILAALALLPVGLGGSARTYAQDKYPSRPIRLLVPFPAGGPTDVMGRLIAQSLSSTLGQQMIVENRPGGGSTLAARAAASAEPDGYTLLLASAASLAIGPALYPNSGYDPATSFASVGAIATVPYVMVAGPGVTARTVPELVAYAKANPGKLNIGVPNGAPPHMIAAWFRALTNTDVMIVPTRAHPMCSPISSAARSIWRSKPRRLPSVTCTTASSGRSASPPRNGCRSCPTFRP